MLAHHRVVLIEDHTLLRAGLRALLAGADDFEVVGDFDNARDGIRALATLTPDLVLLDLGMPGMSGIEAITEIRRRNARVRILVLTIQRAEESIHESLRFGANGYLLKTATQEELLAAMRGVLSGRTCLSPEVSERVVDGYLGRSRDGPPATSWSLLTHREREVLKLVAEGRPNRFIAQFLSLSVKTVEKHRANLMRKLDLHNASELTTYAIEKGLVELRAG
jgi:DNA-binding NarL/FixJ family response regulator